MTMSLVVEHFDDLLATPEDVEQLNHTILQLAVQGKLGTHDQNDEPASDLLAAIHLQKSQKLSKKKVQDAEKVMHIPENWVACPIVELFDLISTRGQQLQTKEYLDKGKYPIVSQGQELIVGYSDQDDLVVHLDKPVIIFGDHTREVKYIDFDFIAGADGIKILNPIQPLNEKYFYLVLKSIHFESRGYARHFQKVTEILFPLPPLAEQQRIVARVEELFIQTRALAKELAHSQIELDGLNKSALSHLLASETPEEFNQHWDFIAEHFDLLFQAPEHVAPLRQSILELAVRGKLTRREAGDGSAGDLLKRISAEKEKPLLPIREDEKPYELPVGWEWARFENIANIATNSVQPDDYQELHHVAPNNIEKGTGRLLDYKSVAEDEVRSINHRFFPGQLLYSKIRPNLSKAVIVDFEGLCSADMYPLDVFIDTHYLLRYILSSVFLEMVTKNDTRVAMPKVNQNELNKVLIAVPPLAEQERIVKRVEQLLSLCDALSARLQSAEEERGRLVAVVMSTVGG